MRVVAEGVQLSRAYIPFSECGIDRVSDEERWADSVWCGGNEEECRTQDGARGRWVTESARRGQR